MPTLLDFAGRPCPAWFAEPQLGIFVHWGIFAIPAWAPRGQPLNELMRENFDAACIQSAYAEWYQNAMACPESPTAAHHRQHYGDATYADFRPRFDAAAEAFDADAWAAKFQKAGARYVVFVTKHHDGYCLWPTEVEHPHRPGWHTRRDFVGELAAAVRARGLRFGVYYSGGLDWTFLHHPIRNLGDMLACVPVSDGYRRYAGAQIRELIARYSPSVLWNDIAWPHKDDVADIFADYYAAVPDGVVNDRWFADAALFASLRDQAARDAFNAYVKAQIAAGNHLAGAPAHCDFRTVEYGMGEVPSGKKWEACRGVGLAFGHNRNEAPEDFMTPAQFQTLLMDVTRQGGNLLINVGPEADGTIPAIQRRAIGM
jgi:alpha-L-fucosidase